MYSLTTRKPSVDILCLDGKIMLTLFLRGFGCKVEWNKPCHKDRATCLEKCK